MWRRFVFVKLNKTDQNRFSIKFKPETLESKDSSSTNAPCHKLSHWKVCHFQAYFNIMKFWYKYIICENILLMCTWLPLASILEPSVVLNSLQLLMTWFTVNGRIYTNVRAFFVDKCPTHYFLISLMINKPMSDIIMYLG